MTAPDPHAPVGLVDLASQAMGGEALYCSDDFFAEMHNLLKPGKAVFLPDEYTEKGKWMDGWESGRTRRASALQDRDECIVRLGVHGRVRVVDVDTSFFLGNHPPFASLHGLRAPWATSVDALRGATWTEILPQSPLRPGSSNVFAIDAADTFSHVKLVIYPDGGVARLRVWGDVDPKADVPRLVDDETKPHVPDGVIDLAGLRNGGRALACSDMFFGSMQNLILPGRAPNMGSGWETRRRRSPGEDWILLQLACPGTLETVELDTNHFKGNYPDDAKLEGAFAPGARITDLLADPSKWATILDRVALGPSERKFFRLGGKGPFSHLRLTVYPDGGVSRLRAWGRPA